MIKKMSENIFSVLSDNVFGLILAALVVAPCLIFAFITIRARYNAGPNPFSLDHVKLPRPLITDHAVRKNVLKQRFKPQKIPENLDAIIIGSGIGGLSTAVLLSRAGQKVLVLEQHDQAGGCCHTFLDKGFEFDTGIHYIGKMMDENTNRVLTDQVTEGQVVWVPMDKEYDRVAIGPADQAKWFSMVSGTSDEFADNLKRQFPTEVDAIDKFMELILDFRSYIFGLVSTKVLPLWLIQFAVWSGLFPLIWRKYSRLSKMSAKQVLDDLTDNEEFKNVMYYLFGDMGTTPSEIGFLAYGQLVNHYMTGAFYPLGGPSEVAFQMIPVIERHGGHVLVDAPVTQIIVDDTGRANGVTVHKSEGDVDIFADKIISDAGVINTFKYLLPRNVAEKTALYKCIDKVGPCVSSITVFVGLTGSPSELGMKTANTWAFTGQDIEAELQAYWSLSVEDASDRDCPVLYVSFPSAKDPSWEERYPGKSVLLIITLVPWSWFAPWQQGKVKHRGDEYQALKERFGHQLLRQCEQLHPELEGKMEYLDVGTPLSNKYYLGQPEGEMYGLDHNKSRFSPEVSMHLRPETEIPGLYLSGQDVLNCGFAGALYAGAMTAEVILGRNLLDDLVPLVKAVRKQSEDKKMARMADKMADKAD